MISRDRKTHSSRRYLLTGLVLVVIGITGGLLWVHDRSDKPTTSENNSKTTSTERNTAADANPDRIRLIATGDWIAHDSVNAAAKQPDGSYNYLPMVNDFAPILQKADIRFCNDPILNGGAAYGIEGYPKFNSPTDFVTDMGRLGCNLVNTASNHSFDRGQDAITASVNAWSGVPNMLAVAGENSSQAGHDEVHYFSIKGVKFAFLAYTTYINTDAPVQNNYGVNVFNQSFAASQIQQAKQNGAQIIIASMRWGTEYSSVVTAEQKQDAQFLANQGVNLILGHGTHVLQAVQQLNGLNGNKTIVWYGIGNFLNTQEPAATLFNGLPIIDFDTKTLQITNMSFLPIYMHYEWTPAQAAADDIAARNNLHMYLLEDATQQMIDSQQLHTTVAAQRQRIASTLSVDGLNIPLITASEL